MARASVSRRLVFIKKTKNPVAPLPQRSARTEPTVERQEPRPRPAVTARPPDNRRFAKLAAIFFGLLCLGAAIGAMGRAQISASSDYTEREIKPSSAASRAPLSSADDYREVGLPAVLSQRSAPTDESFRASAYIRRR